MKRRIVSVLLVLCMVAAMLPVMTLEAAAYADGDWSNGWTWWSQGQSKYDDMRRWGCYVVAKAKLLVDAGIETTDTSKFNPDILYEWELKNGYIKNMLAQDHSEPSIYASRKGKTLTYEGIEYGNNHNKIWENINANKYTILCLSTSTGTHYVYVNNGGSKETGKIRVFDSWSTKNIPGTLDLGNRTVSQIITFSVPNTPTPPTPPSSSVVASGNCGDKGDNVTWTLDNNGTLTIRGSGKMKDYNLYFKVPWRGKISSIKTVVIENGVTSIGDDAFRSCFKLTSVTIPNSVTSIENYAFRGCNSLTSVTIPNSVTSIGILVFEGCDSLTSIAIPNSVTFIGAFAFEYCRNLTSVTIPNSVTSIEDSAFDGCSSLTSMTIPSSVTSIGYGAFRGCDKLSDVYYSGNEKQWSAISIGDRNDPLRNARIYVNTPIALTTVTVNFNAHNGTVYTKKVTTGKNYGTLPTPTRTGYTFTGWYTKSIGGTKVTASTKVKLTAKQTLYAHWSKTAVKATSTKSGSWTVTVPAKCAVKLYTTSTTAATNASLGTSVNGWTLKCTRKATLSNGTTRYYTKVNNKYYWFTYSSEMKVK